MRCAVAGVCAWWVCAGVGYAQQPPPLFSRGAGAGAALASPVRRPPQQPRQVTPNKRSCSVINFEGLDEKVSIGKFQGIASANGWVSGITVEAYGYAMGDPRGFSHAQFVDPPSGITVAVFLNGNNNDITFDTPVSRVSYYYATGYNTVLTAYDSQGNQLASQQVPANWTGNPYGYDYWSQITPLSVQGNKIARIHIASPGAPLNNFIGIDDLEVCTDLAIDSIEMTQAIQQIQTLTELQTSLANSNEPPVPIVAGKPGVMRVYTIPVTDVTSVNMRLNIAGVIDQTKTAVLQPGCTPVQQRYAANGCPSTDFYFTPPEGTWTAVLDVTDSSNGGTIQEEVLDFKSRQTQTYVVKAVSVCDSTSLGIWLCAFSPQMFGNMGLLEKIAPTKQVDLEITGNVIRRDISNYCPDPNNSNTCGDGNWWERMVADIARLYTRIDQGLDLLTNRRSNYHGMVRSNVAGGIGGIADSIPGHASASRTSAQRFTTNLETKVEVVAHENGHTLGLKHTQTNLPSTTVPPGCYNFASDSSTDWPFTDNKIQSLKGPEVGFDVAERKPLNPLFTYDVLSYCSPRWISPQRYKTALTTLGGGSVTTPSLVMNPNTAARPRAVSTQEFWEISGRIPSNGPVVLDPVFRSVLRGDTSGGTGSHSIEVRNGVGTVLFTQYFTPGSPTAETTGVDFQGTPSFATTVPVQAAATQLVLKAPNGTILTTVTLAGAPPVVAVTNPTAAFTGVGSITWTVNDPDSASFTSRVYYSTDNGANWVEIGEVPDSGLSLNTDFSNLAGTNGQGLVRVLVSDGVNTGQATSPNFSIPKKSPSVAQITAPVNNSAQPAVDAVQLIGSAYDPDDGVLTAAALKWSSNLQGQLGTGHRLTVSLQPGVHLITLTATDIDSNSITASSTITIGGPPPTLNVYLKPLAYPPTSHSTCLQFTLDPKPGQPNGAPLAALQYSTNGGSSYTDIPLDRLPFPFVPPGGGFLQAIFRAFDTSGQVDAVPYSYFNSGTCQPVVIPNVVGKAQAAAQTDLQNAGAVVGNVTNASSNTVPAGSVISQSPTAGTGVSPGGSLAVDLLVSSGQAAALAISKTHQGKFGASQTGAIYTISVSNPGSTSTTGTVTVTENIPPGLALTGMTGALWNCSGNTCTRNDALASNSSYPPITVTVNVASNAAASLTNQVSVSTPGFSTATANDSTQVLPYSCNVNGDAVTDAADVQALINQVLGTAAAVHDLNQDAAVNVIDVQRAINAGMGQGCVL